MSVSQIEGGDQIQNGSVGRDKINISTTGQSLITKAIVANGVKITSFTGADSGTGNVTLESDLVYLDTKYPSLVTSRVQGLFLASPITGNGPATFRAITLSDIPSLANGTTSQYIRGDGSLATLPVVDFQTFYVDENMDLIANSPDTPTGYTFSLTDDRDIIVEI